MAAILAAKEQGIGAILAFAMAYLRGRYNGGRCKNSNQRNDVRRYRLVHS
ncbi:phage holin family protein [Ochrobactrum teleogrylli]